MVTFNCKYCSILENGALICSLIFALFLFLIFTSVHHLLILFMSQINIIEFIYLCSIPEPLISNTIYTICLLYLYLYFLIFYDRLC